MQPRGRIEINFGKFPRFIILLACLLSTKYQLSLFISEITFELMIIVINRGNLEECSGIKQNLMIISKLRRSIILVYNRVLVNHIGRLVVTFVTSHSYNKYLSVISNQNQIVIVHTILFSDLIHFNFQFVTKFLCQLNYEGQTVSHNSFHEDLILLWETILIDYE